MFIVLLGWSKWSPDWGRTCGRPWRRVLTGDSLGVDSGGTPANWSQSPESTCSPPISGCWKWPVSEPGWAEPMFFVSIFMLQQTGRLRSQAMEPGLAVAGNRSDIGPSNLGGGTSGCGRCYGHRRNLSWVIAATSKQSSPNGGFTFEAVYFGYIKSKVCNPLRQYLTVRKI